MNEIILIGEVSSKIVKSKNKKILTIYLKVKNDFSQKFDYIPICFRCMNYDYLLSLKGKEIAISGHIETDAFNRIFVDVLNIR